MTNEELQEQADRVERGNELNRQLIELRNGYKKIALLMSIKFTFDTNTSVFVIEKSINKEQNVCWAGRIPDLESRIKLAIEGIIACEISKLEQEFSNL